MQSQFGTGLFEIQTFPCAGGAAPARPAEPPGSTNPPSVVLTPLTHPRTFHSIPESPTAHGTRLWHPQHRQFQPWDVPTPPRCWGYPSPGPTIWGSQEYPSGLIIFPWRGDFFFLGSAHHVDGGKQVPGKYLPAGACGDAAFTGFTASKPRPQSLQISFHHFSRGLITPLAAGGARRSQVQPLLIAGIYYLNVDFQLLFPVPAPRVPEPPLHPKTGAPRSAGTRRSRSPPALSRDELLINGEVSFPASSSV